MQRDVTYRITNYEHIVPVNFVFVFLIEQIFRKLSLLVT